MLIPSGPGALAAGWLTQALRSTQTINSKANVVAFDFPSAEDKQGIAGQHARLRLTYDHMEEQAPHSIFVKFSVADPEARKALHDYKMYLREVKFYQELAGHVPLRAPRCYYSDLDMESGECVLLLEDMSA